MPIEEALEWLDAPVISLASIDAPVPFAPQMENYFLPQVQKSLKRRDDWRVIKPEIL